MAKIAAKNSVILIKGYNFSSYSSAFNVEHGANPIDVTGFGDGCKNFIPGPLTATVTADMFWDSTAGSVNAALYAPVTTNGHVTIIPEGYTLGTSSISLPFTQGNYNPKGAVNDALTIGTIQFVSYGANEGVEWGRALAHATITNTATGTGYQVNSNAVTSRCAATLHIWSSCAADTYVVKVQHCATVDGSYSDLLTFTANGSAITSERQTAASGTINKFVRVLATRTGSAGNSFGYSVHYWQATIG